MRDTQSLAFPHILVIPPLRHRPPALPPLHHHQERQHLRQSRKSRKNKSILIPHIRDPRRNPIINRKTHRIPNNNDRYHSFSTQILVGINAIADAELDAYGVRGGDYAHGEDETEPLDVMRCSYAPEDQRAGDEDERGGEEPETVLGFQDAFVAAGEIEDYAVANCAGIEGSTGDADQG